MNEFSEQYRILINRIVCRLPIGSTDVQVAAAINAAAPLPFTLPQLNAWQEERDHAVADWGRQLPGGEPEQLVTCKGGPLVEGAISTAMPIPCGTSEKIIQTDLF